MLEENTVAPANGHLPVALRVVGKTDTWSRIEEVPLQAAAWDTRSSALNDTVERIASDCTCGRINAGVSWYISVRIQAKGAFVFLVIRSEQAHAQAKIQRQLV